jgi:hypothetical protein
VRTLEAKYLLPRPTQKKKKKKKKRGTGKKKNGKDKNGVQGKVEFFRMHSYLRALPFHPCTRVASILMFVFVTVDDTGKYFAASAESLRYSTSDTLLPQ